MKVASWALVGSLLINLAFALIMAAASAAGPGGASTAPSCTRLCGHRHASIKNPHHASASRYLAATRMGWAIS